MAGVLGDKSVLILGNHGALVIGATLPEAFERLYFLERAAQAQILAMSTGRRLRKIPDGVIAATLEQFKRTSTVGGRGRSELHFAALKRLLDRSEPGYAS